MQANIHPNYHDFEIIMPDGSRFMTKSAAAAKSLHLDVSFKDHPAWSGVKATIREEKKVSGFKNKFGDLDI